jgi:MoxR-like ATPase
LIRFYPLSIKSDTWLFYDCAKIISKLYHSLKMGLAVTKPSRNLAMTGMLDVLCTTHLHGKEEVVRLAVIALLSGGHILIEDLPGLGKTTIALALAGASGLSFGRVQCTSDLLPSDITGLSVFNRGENRFNFMPGPIFNNIVLLDEINRAMPRTQSAMLEAMEERRVTVEGITHALPDPFMVFATQNPSDQSGTFPLPESQLDRFLICTGIGYPPGHLEKRIIAGGGIREKIGAIGPLLSSATILEARRVVAEEIYLSDKVTDYIYDIVSASRSHTMIRTGLSTRAAINLAQAARAAAFLEGRDFVAPEDVRGVALAVCAHRLVMRMDHETADKGEALRELIAGITLPLV